MIDLVRAFNLQWFHLVREVAAETSPEQAALMFGMAPSEVIALQNLALPALDCLATQRFSFPVLRPAFTGLFECPTPERRATCLLLAICEPAGGEA
ncbi:MAG: hypothetical protein HQL38_02460 [Alphaproteobacteria bacterium]|nr:hypothetical protein [Alphaproteobacteria bacterium]